MIALRYTLQQQQMSVVWLAELSKMAGLFITFIGACLLRFLGREIKRFN